MRPSGPKVGRVLAFDGIEFGCTSYGRAPASTCRFAAILAGRAVKKYDAQPNLFH
jgi:hypothetical protein